MTGSFESLLKIAESQDAVFSVSRLTKHIKSLIETDPLLENFLVRGEISNFTRHSQGHLYFSLKDEASQLRCVMFLRNAGTLDFHPEDGQEVTALGALSVYEKRGEYQMYVRAMQLTGAGALFQEFEKLKQRLEKEGLFDPAKKKDIPKFPARMAIVTSPTGAAVRDVINIISRRFPAVEVTIVPAVVQGADAPESIIKALRRADSLPDVDTILLVRGGGSMEDLWGFNDEKLAREIFSCRVPIISGVGHETDFTIADFVADLRAPTPSAAAEIAVPDLAEIKQKIRIAEQRMKGKFTDALRYYKSDLKAASASISPKRLLEILDRRRQLVDDHERDVLSGWSRFVERRTREMENLEGKLTALDPTRVLSRGYSICRDEATGRIIKTVSQVANGKLLRTTVSDGDVMSRVDAAASAGQKSLEFDRQ